MISNWLYDFEGSMGFQVSDPDLAGKIKILSDYRKYFLLISKSGFTPSFKKMAGESVRLIDVRKDQRYLNKEV